MKNITEDSGYEDYVEFLKNLPTTWYPALIVEMVKAAYKKKVFRPGMASTFIKTACEKE